MIAWTGPVIVEPLCLLFTAMWTSNITPEHMTDVLVKYIPKHSRPSLEIREYRPISLISYLGELYAMVCGRIRSKYKIYIKNCGAQDIFC